MGHLGDVRRRRGALESLRGGTHLRDRRAWHRHGSALEAGASGEPRDHARPSGDPRIASLFRPELAAEWRDPTQVAALLVGLGLVGSTTILSVWGAHNHWALRREVLRSRNIGRYELLEELGSGGMGSVWRARAAGMRQDVALKLLPASMLSDRGAVARFEREVGALSTLTHPHTVRVFDFGVTPEGLSYYAMELLRGRNLRQYVARTGPMTPDAAVAVVSQVAMALGEARGHGIVHRDVKPENIMLVDAGPGAWHAKVVDFGVARTEDSDATRMGVVVGTPAWLSPEAALGKTVDVRADVYALGCVLFYALTGRPPFVGDTAELLAAHRGAPAPSVREHAEQEVPDWVEQVVARCLEKDPAARFANGTVLAAALGASRVSFVPSDFGGTEAEVSSETIDLDLEQAADGPGR